MDDATHDWRTAEVQAVRAVADEVVELTLAPADGSPVEAWEPGAHLELETAPGSGPTVRHYSLCGPADPAAGWRVAVLREPGGRGGSAWVHDALRPGSTLRVRGPRNRFPLGSHDHALLLAGGIGITPVMAMAEALAAGGRSFDLHYGGRSRSSMAYLDDLAARHGERLTVHAQDEVGLPDLDALLADLPAGAAVYCCGPPGLLEAAAAAAERHGVADALHVERFTGGDEGVAGATGPGAGAGEEDEGFVVELAASGGEVEVAPGESILEAVRGVVPDALSSCEEGWCGTCETRVLDGTPLHRDEVLTAAEQEAGDTMMICVGRSCTPRLVLDL